MTAPSLPQPASGPAAGSSASSQEADPPFRLRPIPASESNPSNAAWRTQRLRWAALAASGLLLTVTLGFAVYNQVGNPIARNYLEVYLSDLPAEFSRVEIRLGSVFVGADDEQDLHVEQPVFDLLAYRGPEHALRVAYGDVRSDADFDTIGLEFEAVWGELDGERVPALIPDPVLWVKHGFDLEDVESSALLFDIDLEKSLILTERGLTFQPTVKRVYFHDYTTGEDRDRAAAAQAGQAGPAPPFAADANHDPPAQARGDRPSGGPAQNPFNPSSPTWHSDPSPSSSSSSSTSAPASSCLVTCLPSGGSYQGATSNDDVQALESFANELGTTLGETALMTVSFAEAQLEQNGVHLMMAPPAPEVLLSGVVGPETASEDSGSQVQFNADGVPLYGEAGQFMAGLIEAEGGRPVYQYLTLPAMAALLTPEQAFQLLQDPTVAAITPLNYDVVPASLASAQVVSQLTQLLQASPALTDEWGSPIDGRGVGVAVIDSGIDGGHADLRWDESEAVPNPTHVDAVGLVEDTAGLTEPPVRMNFKVLPNLNLAGGLQAGPLYTRGSGFFVNQAVTDTTSGHGTYVSGLIAGQPSATVQGQRGFATGSRLYGFGIGETAVASPLGNPTGNPSVPTTLLGPLWVDAALDFIDAYHDQFSPPIRVVNLAVAIGTKTYDPNLPTNQILTHLAADHNVVVVVAVSNDGGNGISGNQVQGIAQNPTEGIIAVGSFNDRENEGLGFDRSQGRTSSFSARGLMSTPGTWPDLVAPGENVRSARALVARDTGVSNAAGLLPYHSLTGTSVATPIVAAAAALVIQADPVLTAGQIEALLEDTAYRFAADGSYAVSGDPRYDGCHYAKGCGLLDIDAAVRAALQP